MHSMVPCGIDTTPQGWERFFRDLGYYTDLIEYPGEPGNHLEIDKQEGNRILDRIFLLAAPISGRLPIELWYVKPDISPSRVRRLVRKQMDYFIGACLYVIVYRQDNVDFMILRAYDYAHKGITTLIWSFNPQNISRTDLEIIQKLRVHDNTRLNEVYGTVCDALSVQPVTGSFFNDIRDLYRSESDRLKANEDISPASAESFVIRLISRLLFLRFVERKGWLRIDGQDSYLPALLAQFQSDLYDSALKPLFFQGLNTRENKPQFLGDVPFLNGGLFDPHPDDLSLKASDEFIRRLVDILYSYNFVVTESTPLEQQVAVDPEMLGHVFENLISYRQNTGSFYTPSSCVAFMCRLALEKYLAASVQEDEEAIRALVWRDDASGIKNPGVVLSAVKDVRILDPACGSGAFLIGMLQELMELYETLEPSSSSKDRYDRKLHIIQNNLYGVDIDEAAVQLARLRLWLSLVVDDDRNPITDPDADVALPNLDFKIEAGDSVSSISPAPTGNSSFGYDVVNELSQVYNQYLSCHGAQTKRKLQEQINALREEIAQWFNVSPDSFQWVTSFPNVLFDENGDRSGFDIVISNPPYVRQEHIDNKEQLKALYGDFFTGKSDLYTYFYHRGLSLLKDGGWHIFICSNSWLDVDFGKVLQKYLLDNAHLMAVYDTSQQRQFSSADVNTVITLIRKQVTGDDDVTEFVVLDKSYEDMLDGNIQSYRVIRRTRKQLLDEGTDEEGKYQGSKWGGKYLRAPDIYFTILDKAGNKLVPLGSIAEVRFGIKTGANEFFYLKPIGMSVKEVVELASKNPTAPVTVENGVDVRDKNGKVTGKYTTQIEACWLRPAVKSPREVNTVELSLDEVSYMVLMPPDDVCSLIGSSDTDSDRTELINSYVKLRYPLAGAYIDWGQQRGYDNKATCASRTVWWYLGAPITSGIAIPERHQQRYFVVRNLDRVCLNKSFYGIQSDIVVQGCMMSHISHLFAELIGRTPGGGGGPLDLDVNMVEQMYVLSPRTLSQQQVERIRFAIDRMSNRQILTIFEELGLPKPNKDYSNIRPEDVCLDKVLPDRRALDQVVFEVLGLTEEEQLEVYRAVVTLVKNRLVKAISV